jgi:hypothetical protein
MLLFEVRYEENGRTVTAPGVSETEIRNCTVWYAAESIEAVWKAVAHLRDDPEKRFTGIMQALPLVMVIPAHPSERE